MCINPTVSSGFFGTARWMAYEQICNFGDNKKTPYTVKTDVWSFGMTALVSLLRRHIFRLLLFPRLIFFLSFFWRAGDPNVRHTLCGAEV